jgi:hypothetical protein
VYERRSGVQPGDEEARQSFLSASPARGRATRLLETIAKDALSNNPV